MATIPHFTGGTASVRDKLNRMVDAINMLMNMQGDGNFIATQRVPNGFAIKLNIYKVMAHIPKVFGAGNGNRIWVQLTQSTPIGGLPNQWTYSGTQMTRTMTGWQPSPGSPTISPIYNSIEYPNSATGVQGHGVDITKVSAGGNYPNGYSVKPISRGKPIVEVVQSFVNHQPVYTCQMSNADDGTCT